jgi:hypothetical protein
MNKLLKDMLVGTILGDSHVARVGTNKAFITFEQTIKKSDYLNYLHETVLKEGLNVGSITKYIRNDSRYNKINESLYFKSENSEALRTLADNFLNEANKKIIPANIEDLLTPRGLAFWIMDDGQQVKNGGVTLCTDSYSSAEVQTLRGVLKAKFNLDTTLHTKKGINSAIYERIYIKKDSLEVIKPSLMEHMHDSMLYKLNEDLHPDIDLDWDIDLDLMDTGIDLETIIGGLF